VKIICTLFLALLCPCLTNAAEVIYADDVNNKVPVVFNNLSDLAQDFNLDIDTTNFKLQKKTESLLGTHYYFKQVVDNYDVDNAVIIVSVDKDGNVSQIYNNANPNVNNQKVNRIPFITQEKALELAWNHLKVNGELLDNPIVKLLVSSKSNLVYKVTIGVSSPFGYWDLTIDAQTGDILSVTDAFFPRMKSPGTYGHRDENRPLTSFNEALEDIQNKNKDNFNLINSFDLSFVSGTALVFDPNPSVTLKRSDLEDSTAASVFLPAYMAEELKEITFSNSIYSLKGPKVTLIDFESPKIAPSTSRTASWTATRGNNSFTDAMTYVHLDRSLRYLETLGYAGSKALFKKSLEVDANGVNGEDNSHYIPSSDRLAFGHGCVDDNEDTDVILHELGHAIETHIGSWSGGDTGAMGEGFGDYWASSYSVSRPNGLEVHPEWVYKWDGHNKCWPGRRMDAFTPKYNPSRTYEAHAKVDGGNADELWSTPIFQAFLELYKRGVPREVMDQIMIEAHFGLGYGTKIPQMATNIVKTAKKLFPENDYDQVYLKHFKNQGILK